MKRFFRIPTLVFTATLIATAQERQPTILSGLVDGSELTSVATRSAFKPAEVIDTKTHYQAGRSVTIQRLALDPGDPVIPVRKQETPVISPNRKNTSSQVSPEFIPDTSLIFLSATVYPGPVSKVTWTCQNSEGKPVSYSGWSNLDFNHFSGFSSFRASDDIVHSLIMGIGNSDTLKEKVPHFKTEAPQFVPVGKIPARDLAPMISLHKLYENEGQRLAAAHEGRKRAEATRKAELLANPLQPKDLIIRYRIAETPSANEGGDK